MSVPRRGAELCRTCLGTSLASLLDLGVHPPANAFRSAAQLGTPEPAYPLEARVCRECGLVQVPDLLPRSFFDEYLYVPSGSVALPRHFEELAAELVGAELAQGGLLVDVGCNEGLLLRAVAALGGRVLGIDPALNLAPVAQAHGVPVLSARLDPATARAARDEHGPAAAVVTTNTLNHVDDLDAFMDSVQLLLGPAGTFIVEVPRLEELYAQTVFDTLYHEHLSLFGVRALSALVGRHGMRLDAVEPIAVHGGSMRVRATARGGDDAPDVRARIEAEDAAGVRDPARHAAFRERALRLRDELRELVRSLRARGATVAGYGAPAKATTWLCFTGLGPEDLLFVADRSPFKQGRFTPGTHVPVVAPELIDERAPDYLIVFAWNYASEILEQLAPYRRRGGRLILPIPDVRIVE